MKRKILTTMPQHTTTTSSTSKAPKEVVLKPTEPEVPRMAFTIKEFCAAHRISPAMYFKLRAAGLGPREMRARHACWHVETLFGSTKMRRQFSLAPMGVNL
jgi:hypothetical protein